MKIQTIIVVSAAWISSSLAQIPNVTDKQNDPNKVEENSKEYQEEAARQRTAITEFLRKKIIRVRILSPKGGRIFADIDDQKLIESIKKKIEICEVWISEESDFEDMFKVRFEYKDDGDWKEYPDLSFAIPESGWLLGKNHLGRGLAFRGYFANGEGSYVEYGVNKGGEMPNLKSAIKASILKLHSKNPNIAARYLEGVNPGE